MPTSCAPAPSIRPKSSLKVHISLSQVPENANGKKARMTGPFFLKSPSSLTTLSESGSAKSGTFCPILRTMLRGNGVSDLSPTSGEVSEQLEALRHQGNQLVLPSRVILRAQGGCRLVESGEKNLTHPWDHRLHRNHFGNADRREVLMAGAVHLPPVPDLNPAALGARLAHQRSPPAHQLGCPFHLVLRGPAHGPAFSAGSIKQGRLRKALNPTNCAPLSQTKCFSHECQTEETARERRQARQGHCQPATELRFEHHPQEHPQDRQGLDSNASGPEAERVGKSRQRHQPPGRGRPGSQHAVFCQGNSLVRSFRARIDKRRVTSSLQPLAEGFQRLVTTLLAVQPAAYSSCFLNRTCDASCLRWQRFGLHRLEFGHNPIGALPVGLRSMVDLVLPYLKDSSLQHNPGCVLVTVQLTSAPA